MKYSFAGKNLDSKKRLSGLKNSTMAGALLAQIDPATNSSAPNPQPLIQGLQNQAPQGMPQGMNSANPPGLPHDIAEIIHFNTPWYYYAVAVLAVLFVLLMCYLVYKYARDKINNKPVVVIPVDPWAVLTEDLKKLKPSEPFLKETQVEYYYQLSLLLRQAIEYRTLVRATDLTYQELKAPLDKKLPFKRDDRLALMMFLEKADLIKFAESEASIVEAQQSRIEVKQWVQKLKPKEELGGAHAIR